jgi:hypothetical protein
VTAGTADPLTFLDAARVGVAPDGGAGERDGTAVVAAVGDELDRRAVDVDGRRRRVTADVDGRGAPALDVATWCDAVAVVGLAACVVGRGALVLRCTTGAVLDGGGAGWGSR